MVRLGHEKYPGQSSKFQILWMCQAMDSLSVAESIVRSSNYRGWNSSFSILQQNFTDTVEIRLYAHEKSRTLSKSDCTRITRHHTNSITAQA